jgi:hypothetical protein
MRIPPDRVLIRETEGRMAYLMRSIICRVEEASTRQEIIRRRGMTSATDKSAASGKWALHLETGEADTTVCA